MRNDRAIGGARSRAAIQPTPTADRAPARADEPPVIRIAGSDVRMRGVTSALEAVPAALRDETDAYAVLRDLRESDAAVVLVDPLPRLELESALRLLEPSARNAAVPIVAVVGTREPADRVRDFHAAGAQLVFEWPREAILMRHLLQRLVESDDWPRDSGAPLGDAIEARLGLLDDSPADLSLDLRDGAVTLRGRVESAADCRRLAACVARTPGVEALRTEEVRIDERLPAASMSVDARVRALLRSDPRLAGGAVLVAVCGAEARVAGTTASQEDADRLAARLLTLPGITAVSERTRKDPRAAARADHIARSIEWAACADLAAHRDLHVAVVGSTAYLTGVVGERPAVFALEEAAERHPAIDAVVNATLALPGRGDRRSGSSPKELDHALESERRH